jgi:hypothetical protein
MTTDNTNNGDQTMTTNYYHTDNTLNNWTRACEIAIEEQAVEGQFNYDSEALFTLDDADATFTVLTGNLSPDNLQDWLINDDEAMDLFMQAVRHPKNAEHYMTRLRHVMGTKFLYDNRAEIEERHHMLKKQYAADAYWDARMDAMRDEMSEDL